MINDIVNTGLQPTVSKPASEPSTGPKVSSAEELTAQPEQKDSTVEQAELQSAVSKLNDYVQNISRTLSYSIEETTGTTIVQVYDSTTEELIRQIPTEETIKLAASIEANSGLLIQEQA